MIAYVNIIVIVFKSNIILIIISIFTNLFELLSAWSYTFETIKTLCVSVNTCTVPTVSNATVNTPPNIEYNSTVTYTCQAGFSHTAGDLTRSCRADRSLTGSTPVCSSKLHYQCWLSVILISGNQFICTYWTVRVKRMPTNGAQAHTLQLGSDIFLSIPQ